MTQVVTKQNADLPVDRKEILRYAGCPNDKELPLLDECLGEAEAVLSFRSCFRVCDVFTEQERVRFDSLPTLVSFDLSRALHGCRRAVIFAATAGVGIDRLIIKYGRIAPSRALLLQAIGAERIETFVGALCADLRQRFSAEGSTLRPRFSPGYGDFPLAFQRDIFSLLDCPKRIGVTLNDSLLMSPSKSVTAVVGIAEQGD